MKSLLFILISAFFFISTPNTGKDKVESKVAPSDGQALIHYAHQIEGLWTEIGFKDEAGLNLKISPKHIKGDILKISISDYTIPGFVQYIHFKYENKRLIYVGASMEDNFFDLPKIDFIHIWYEVNEGDTILFYEAREMEYQNYVKVKMKRSNPDNLPTNFWACGFQSHLIDYFKAGDFEIYDQFGNTTTTALAFGTEAIVEELEFFEENPTLWPMYEEVCVRTDFEMVVLGSFSPQGTATIYGIEWEPEEIRLYETQAATNFNDGLFPLEKGQLAYTIRPNLTIMPLIE